MRPSLLAAFGLVLATAACGTGMEEKPASAGLGGATAGAGAGGLATGSATQAIGEREQSGSGSTYSAPASRSTATR